MSTKTNRAHSRAQSMAYAELRKRHLAEYRLYYRAAKAILAAELEGDQGLEDLRKALQGPVQSAGPQDAVSPVPERKRICGAPHPRGSEICSVQMPVSHAIHFNSLTGHSWLWETP